MDLRSIKEWADRMERRVSELEAKGQISEQRIDEHSDEIGALGLRADAVERATYDFGAAIDAISERITALEGYHVPPPPVPNLTKYEEIVDDLCVRYHDQWDTLARVGHDYARHAIDGAHWMYEATGDDAYRTSAYTWAEMAIDAVLARDRSLDDLRLVSGFRLLGDEEIDKRLVQVAIRAATIIMSTGQDFMAWVRSQHRLTFSWNPPQGEWQGVVGYYTRCFDGGVTDTIDAFRECVERGTPGVWGATWDPQEDRYRNARNSHKAGRDARLIEIDESLRPIFEAAWGRISVPGGDPVTKYIDGDVAHGFVGVPLFDGWNYIVPPDLLDRVLDDVIAGRSNLMANVNTHPTGVRQLALCGATALRRTRG